MDEDTLTTFLMELAEKAKAGKPSLLRKVDAFAKALKTSEERKPSGGRTDAARQAKQKIENPVFKSTYRGKAKQVAAGHVQKLSREFTSSLVLTISKWALLCQAELELKLMSEEAGQSDAPSPQAAVSRNRRNEFTGEVKKRPAKRGGVGSPRAQLTHGDGIDITPVERFTIGEDIHLGTAQTAESSFDDPIDAEFVEIGDEFSSDADSVDGVAQATSLNAEPTRERVSRVHSSTRHHPELKSAAQPTRPPSIANLFEEFE